MHRDLNKIFLLSALVQVVSYARILVIAAFFGASGTLDAYYLALIVPTFISGALASILQGSFVPVYVGLLSRNDLAGANNLRSAIFWVLALFLTAFAIIVSVFAPYWTTFIIHSDAVSRQILTAQAMRIVAFTLPFLGLFDFCGLVLNAHRRFVLATAAPIANVLVSVSLLVLIGRNVGGLTWSLLGGTLAQFLVIVFGWRQDLPLLLKPTWDWPNLGYLGGLAAASGPAFLLSQLQFAFIQTLPATLGVGAVSIFGYAVRLQGVIEQVFIVGLGTVLLPHLAHFANKGDAQAIKSIFRQLVLYSGAGGLVAIVWVYLFGATFIFILFGHGEFDVGVATRVAHVWTLLAIMTFPSALNIALTKLTLALEFPLVLAGISAVSLITAFVLGPPLVSYAGLKGVAIVLVTIHVVRLVTFWAALKFICRFDVFK